MLKDDIVGLLPDLRAFARFMCREREAADDLVQNTVLAALDKQSQFEAGTNLKGWLFTIMRNSHHTAYRVRKRESPAAAGCAAAWANAVPPRPSVASSRARRLREKKGNCMVLPSW